MTSQQPTDLVHGTDGPVMLIGARTAVYLNSRSGLEEFRIENRGADGEADSALVAEALGKLDTQNPHSDEPLPES